jgi:CHAT domain-containing protein
LPEAKDALPKIEARREAQLELLNGKIGGGDERLVTNWQIAHEEGKPETAKQPRFTADPKRPFAHPYYWRPLF